MNRAGVAALEALLDGLLDQFFEPRKAARRAPFSGSEVMSSYWMVDELMKMRWMPSEPLVDVLRTGHDAGTLHSPNPEADAINLFAVVSIAATSSHAYRGGAGPGGTVRRGGVAHRRQTCRRLRQPGEKHAS